MICAHRSRERGTTAILLTCSSLTVQKDTHVNCREEEERCRHRRFGSRLMRQCRAHMTCVFLNEQIVSKLSWKERTVTRTMVLVLKQGRLRTHMSYVSGFGVQAEQSPWILIKAFLVKEETDWMQKEGIQLPKRSFYRRAKKTAAHVIEHRHRHLSDCSAPPRATAPSYP
jgi:hypothetical protein